MRVNIRTTYYILLFTGILLLNVSVFAQTSDERYYTHERIRSKNGWLSGDNAAGLTFNETSLSTVDLNYNFERGGLHNVNEGVRQYTDKVGSESYRRLGNFSLYGNLGYSYSSAIDRRWAGNTNLYTSPMAMGDSIPGNTRGEVYSLIAGASYKIGRWAVGASVTYQNQDLAKRRDLRNETIYMNLNVSPGVVFTSKYVNMGLSFNYNRITESVAYEAFGTNQDVGTVYFFEGLWFYTSEIQNSNLLGNADYQGDAYRGAYQMELVLGRVRFFNQFSAEYSKMERYRVKENMRMGDSDCLTYRYLGVLNINGERVDHRLSVDFSSADLMKYNNLQELELDPETNSMFYKQYGRFLKFTERSKNVDANYKIFVKRNAWSSSWIFDIAYRYYNRASQYTISPAKYRQNLNSNRFSLGVLKNFMIDDCNWIDVNVKGGYMFGGGTELDIVCPENVNIENERYNSKLLKEEYNYLTNSRLCGEVGVRYNHYFKSQKLGLYIDVRGKGEKGRSGMFSSKRRGIIFSTVGLSF